MGMVRGVLTTQEENRGFDRRQDEYGRTCPRNKKSSLPDKISKIEPYWGVVCS